MARTGPRPSTARTRPRLPAAQRGYDHKHRAERERRLRLYRPGDPCAIGGEPLPWWPLRVARRYIDLPHDHVNGGYLPGLACRRHNRQEGQRMTTAILRARRGMTRRWQASRQW